jgi:hypothetical protein
MLCYTYNTKRCKSFEQNVRRIQNFDIKIKQLFRSNDFSKIAIFKILSISKLIDNFGTQKVSKNWKYLTKNRKMNTLSLLS